MKSQIGMANGIGFCVQCETYTSNRENKIIITGVEEKNIKYIYEQARIIETYVKKNILNFNNLDLHFNFLIDYQYACTINSGFAVFVSLISKLKNIPIEEKFVFYGKLDIYGNIFIEKNTDIETITEINKFMKKKTICSPLIDRLETSNYLTISNTKEFAEKFPVLSEQEKNLQIFDYNCLDLSRCFL